ncbi:MAG: T9SS type A sorting domain-containing protein [Crocinitomicaceae bacterium]
MNLTKTISFTIIFFFSFVSFSQQAGTPSYSATSCNGKIYTQNPGLWNAIEWYTEDTVLLATAVDTVYNLCPGNYLCHWLNGSNWVWSYSKVLDRDSCRNFSTMFSRFPPTLPDSCNGSVEVYEGALFYKVNPYTFQWNTGATTREINNACIGTYEVFITDGYGCKDTLLDSIYAWNSSIPNPDIIHWVIPTGYHNCDGEIGMVVQGLTPPYTAVVKVNDEMLHPYNVDNDTVFTVAMTSDTLYLYDICAGDVEIQFIDSEGWESYRGLFMYDTLYYNGCHNFEIYVNTTNVSTSTSCDGTATVFATGNDGMVSYYWLDAQQDTISTDDFLDSLCSGSLIVHAYDQNNCYLNYVSTVGDSNGIVIDYTIINEASTPTTCDGEYHFQVSGGTPPYITLNWLTADSNNLQPNNLCPDVHRFDVWDATNSYQGLNYLVVPQNQLFNGIQGGTPVDTLNGLPVERCDIDYDDIVSAYIINYTIVDSTITTDWVINYGSGGNAIVSVNYIANIDTSQVYAFSLSIYCSQLKAVSKRFKAYSDLSGTVLALFENETVDILVYPNPANGKFTIASPKEGFYQLFQANGAMISQGKLKEGDQLISTEAKGVLLLRMITNNGVVTKRIVLE